MKKKTPKGFSDILLDDKKYKIPVKVHAFIDQQHKVNQATQQQIGQLCEIIYNVVEETTYEFPGGESILAWQHMAKDAHSKYQEFLEISKKEETETPSPSEVTSEEETEHQKV